MGLFRKKISEFSDEELMVQLSEGNQRAFDEIYTRYAQPLLYYFMRMLKKDKEKAEDFVHDFFSKIIKNPTLFDTSRVFKTWTYSVANNMCKNEYKKMAVRAGMSNGLDESYQISDKSNSVSNQVHEKQFSTSLIDALETLDDKHKETFTLRHFQDLSIKEIAEVTNKSEGTVKSRLFYATKKLAELLKDYNPVLNM